MSFHVASLDYKYPLTDLIPCSFPMLFVLSRFNSCPVVHDLLLLNSTSGAKRNASWTNMSKEVMFVGSCGNAGRTASRFSLL